MKRCLVNNYMMLLSVVAAVQITVGVVSKYSSKPTIFVITPTVARLEQKADLTRLSNTLRWVPSLHWIIIEDAKMKTPLVKNFLVSCGISYTHLNSATPKSRRQLETGHRGVMQRNTGLDWIRKHQFNSGVVYFADDDNTYDIRIFEEMRYTKGVSIWPVGLAGGLAYETPILKQGKVIGFRCIPKGRTFPTDMAGFAVSIKLLTDKPSAKFHMSANAGCLEDDLLKQLGISLADLEPKADECSKLFRLLQGSVLHNEKKMLLLKARDEGISVASAFADDMKKKKVVQNNVASCLNAKTWEEARSNYPSYTSDAVLDMYKGLRMQNNIPRPLLDFLNKASEDETPPVQPDKLIIKLEIKYEGVDVYCPEIKRKYEEKIRSNVLSHMLKKRKINGEE